LATNNAKNCKVLILIQHLVPYRCCKRNHALCQNLNVVISHISVYSVGEMFSVFAMWDLDQLLGCTIPNNQKLSKASRMS